MLLQQFGFRQARHRAVLLRVFGECLTADVRSRWRIDKVTCGLFSSTSVHCQVVDASL